jgi:hypothetical protein
VKRPVEPRGAGVDVTIIILLQGTLSTEFGSAVKLIA